MSSVGVTGNNLDCENNMGQDQFEPSNQLITEESVCLPDRNGARQNFRGMLFTAEKLLLRSVMNAFGNPPVHVVLWDGLEIPNTNGNAVAQVLLRDRGVLLKLIADPGLNFAELYSAQRIDVIGDLLEFLEAVYQVWPVSNHGKIRKLLAPFVGLQRNTFSKARSNVSHHYDIGNDFYKLWLDERMLYTCAYFPSPDLTLEDAQLAKMDHVCRKLRLKPGETVVEAGCGWGALSLHMAKHYGVKVKAYNISKEQLAFARERADKEGMNDQVEFIEDDYRNVRGKYDAFVSVGMLEHIGVDHFQELGAVIDRCLKAEGRGLIHSIGMNYPRPIDAWAERYIFPGAGPPSLGQLMQIFEPFDFSVLDVENLRLHYAKTLEHWLRRYENNADQVLEMFDQEFVRAWRLYLAGSVATFKTGDMQLFQVVFTRAGNNQIPWTRQALYEPQSSGIGGTVGKL